MAGWNADTAAGPVGAGTVTLVEGSSFSISAANGDILPDLPHGVFHDDTRILSAWKLTVNGQPLEPLTAETKEPYRALFIGRVPRSDGYRLRPRPHVPGSDPGQRLLEQAVERAVCRERHRSPDSSGTGVAGHVAQ